jgi:DNA-binding MarR family transcriptional regulator
MSESGSVTPADETFRWLSAPEQDAWRCFLEAARGLFEILEKQLITDAGMPMAYYDILVALSEAPDQALRMGELARRLRCSASRLTHAMGRLEKDHWVRRESTAADRRGAVAVLTPAGRDALAAAAPGHVAAVRRNLIEHLTPQQLTQLTEISRAFSPVR